MYANVDESLKTAGWQASISSDGHGRGRVGWAAGWGWVH